VQIVVSNKIEPLSKFYEFIIYCRHCGNCKKIHTPLLSKQDVEVSSLPNCPAYEKMLFEAYAAAGRREIMFDVLEGLLPLDEKTAKIMYMCNLCGACQEQCLSAKVRDHYKPLEAFEAFREAAVRGGVGPMPNQKKIGESIRTEHNPYFQAHNERFSWYKSTKPDKADVLYFVGCTAAYLPSARRAANSTLRILDKAGVKPFVVQDEWCCGAPLLETGQTSYMKEIAEHNVKMIEETGVGLIVTSCPGCYKTLKVDYHKKLGLKSNFEVFHTVELINDVVNKGKLRFAKRIEEKVTYHDPCHLGRHLDFENKKGLSGLYEQPRNILKNIPGLEFNEMLRVRELSWCCGAGGGVKADFPDLARFAGYERVREALSAKISRIVSSCPLCETHFLDCIRDMNVKISVSDIVELVERAL
jgi:heterodisulfide reductase subunit D